MFPLSSSPLLSSPLLSSPLLPSFLFSSPLFSSLLSQDAVRELGILRELRHEHIVNLLHVRVHFETREVSLVLEWADYDLQVIIRHHHDMEKRLLQNRHKAYIPLAMIRAVMYQLLDAADYLHSNWIMHRDIKPANVLITADGIVKMADFGIARVFQAPPRPLVDDRTVVTLYYRAPELLLGTRHYTPAIDVWSLGAVFGELILSSAIFASLVPKEEEASGIFRGQLFKIFEVLGCPDTTIWPAVADMPYWDKVREDTTARVSTADAAMALRSRLYQRLEVNGTPADCKSAIDVLLRMCTYDPVARITSRDAKTLAFFNGYSRGNVLSEYGSNWKIFYSEQRKSNVPN